MPDLNTLKNLIAELGWTKGVFAIFFFLAHFWIYRLYKRNIKDKQSEINRIAESNKELRDENKELRDELRRHLYEDRE